MPATSLRVVQLGKETTWGTAVAATAKLMGVKDASLSPVAEKAAIPDLGSLAPSMREVQTAVSAKGHIELEASYQDILYLLHGVFGAVTPTGTAAPYTWTYSAPLTSAPTPQIYTMEYGEANSSYKGIGMFATNLAVKIEAKKTWSAACDLLGKSVNTVTLASLSDRTVEVIRAADTHLYMDTWSGTMGSTEITATLISAALDVDTKRHLKDFVSGAVTPSTYGEDRWDGKLVLVLEFNSSAKAIVDALLAPALIQRQIRLKATSGTSYAQVDFCGTLDKGLELFGDRDGNMTVELTFTGTYNSTFANWLKIIVANDVATLT